MNENVKSLLSALRNAPNSEALAGWISLNLDSLEEQIFIEIADTIRMTPTLSCLQQKLQTAYAVYQYMGNHQRFRLILLEELMSEKVRITARSRDILQKVFEASPESMFAPIGKFHYRIDETFWKDWGEFTHSLVDDRLINHMRALKLCFEQLLRDPRMPHIQLAADALVAFESTRDVDYYTSQFTEDTLLHMKELVSNVEAMRLKDEEEIAGLCEFVDAVKAQVKINELRSNIIGDKSLKTHFERELAMLRKLSQEKLMTNDVLSKTVDYAALFGLESDAAITDLLHLAMDNDAITMTTEEGILAGALFFSFQTSPSRFTVLAVEEIGGKFTDERLVDIFRRLQELGEIFEDSELSNAIIKELDSSSADYILANRVVQREGLYSFLEGIQYVVDKVWKVSPEIAICHSFIDYAAAYADLGYSQIAQKLLTFVLLLVSGHLATYELVSVYIMVGVTYTLNVGIPSETLKLCNYAQSLLVDTVKKGGTVLPINQFSEDEKKHYEEIRLPLLPLELYLARFIALTSLGRYMEAEQLLNSTIAYARRLQFTYSEQYSILQGFEWVVEGLPAYSVEYLPEPLFSFFDSLLFQVRATQGKNNPDLTLLTEFSKNFTPESGTMEALFAQKELNVVGRSLDATLLIVKGKLNEAYAYAWSALKQSQSRVLIQNTLYSMARIELESGSFLSAQQHINLSLDFAHIPQHYFSREEILEFLDIIGQHKGSIGNSNASAKNLPPYFDTEDFSTLIERHTAESVSIHRNPYVQAQILILRGEIVLRLGLYEKALEDLKKTRALYTQTQAYIERVNFLTIFGETCLILGQHDLFKEITVEMQELIEKHIASPILRKSYLNAIYLLEVSNSKDLEMCREAVQRYEKERSLIKGINMGLLELYGFKSGGQRYLQIALLAEDDKDYALFNQALDSAAEQWMQCFGILLKDFSLPYDFWTGIEHLFYFGDTNLVSALLYVFSDSEWLSIIDRKALGEPSFSNLHFIAGTWGILGMALFLVRQQQRISRPISEEAIELLIRTILAITDSYLPDADHEQWQFYLAKARVLRFLGYTDIAQKYYSKVLEIIEKLRNQLSNQNYRIGLAQTLEEIMMEYVLFSHRYKITESNEIFAMVEQGRSRAFLDILENSDLAFVRGVNPEQAMRVADLQAQIRELLNNSGYIVTPQIRVLQMELEDTWQHIQGSKPEYFDLFQANPARFKDIQPLIAG